MMQDLRCENERGLGVQNDVFEEELTTDTDVPEKKGDSCNASLNEAYEVFKIIQDRVQGTPLNATFMQILKGLSQFEIDRKHRETTWNLIEKFIQQAVSSDSTIDLQTNEIQLRRNLKIDKEVQTDDGEDCPTQISRWSVLANENRLSTNISQDEGNGIKPDFTDSPPSPCRSPTPPPSTIPAVPAELQPHPANTLPGLPCVAPPLTPPPSSPPPPPPPPLLPLSVSSGCVSGLPQSITTPSPNCKMKTFSWNKIPAHSCQKNSVWEDIAKMNDSIPVDYKRLEERFEKKSDSPKLRKHSTSAEISVLDAKKSMNINIFLKQFKKTTPKMIDLLTQGDPSEFGLEKLKSLCKILPSPEEVEHIQQFEGDMERLGEAEKFYCALINLPEYQIRIETMILKAEFSSQIESIRGNTEMMDSVCSKLFDNASLKLFLRFVLHTGNFINKGSNFGNAIGFRIGSLNKLVMVKSLPPHMTLLHHLVEEAEQNNKAAIAFVDDLLVALQNASRFSMETITAEFNQLKKSVTNLQRKVEQTEEEVKKQFSGFLEEAETDLRNVEEAIDGLKILSKKLAQHYCENEKAFNLDEFLESFREFCEKVQMCQQELESNRLKAESADKRRKTQEEIQQRRRSSSMHSPVVNVQDRQIVNLIDELRHRNREYH